ncbi:MAG: hypothetical protein ACLQPD_04680 [Desulfomonilaceae bacterium]
MIRILRKKYLWLLLLVGFLFAVTSVSAQDQQPESSLKVVQAWLVSIDKRLPIWIEVRNIGKWAEQHRDDISKFVVCINGVAYKDFAPILGKDDWLGFQTDSSSEFKRMWKNCVTAFLDKKDSKAIFTVLYNGTRVAGNATGRIAPNYSTLVAFLVGIIIAIAGFAFLSYYTDIIREPGSQPKEGRKRYSLARTQMAWWSLIVLFSYCFIWWLTRDLTVLTSSAVVLIGISVGTGLGSAIVDSSRRTEQEKKLSALEEEENKNKVDAELKKPKNPATSAPSDSEEQPSSKIDQLKGKLAPKPSTNILCDILSDDDGVSFHRFQIFAWTIALTGIFVITVWHELAMPDFDATVLALMGISGGTYIGFKIPNQQG